MGADRITVVIPDGWARTGDYSKDETLLLELTAPSSYSNGPTTIQLRSYIGPRRGTTAHALAQEDTNLYTKPSLSNPSPVPTSPVYDCSIAGDQASFFSYTLGSRLEHRIYVLHADFLYVVVVDSRSGIDPRVAQDLKGFLGSWVWGPGN